MGGGYDSVPAAEIPAPGITTPENASAPDAQRALPLLKEIAALVDISLARQHQAEIPYYSVDAEFLHPEIKVSVIIPVYNVEKYLRECLDSVVNQTLREIEIICVDDGSTDSSPQILAEYAARDKRIKILHQKNRYAGVARNNGMKIAKGKYLWFCDSDDYIVPQMLEKMFARAERTQADIVVCDYQSVYASDNKKNRRHMAGTQEDRERTVFRFTEKTKSLGELAFNPWNKLFSREFVMATGNEFLPLRSSNDVTFVCFACVCAQRISIVPDALYFYRGDATGNISSTRGNHQETNIIAWLEVEKRFKAHNLYEKLKPAILEAQIPSHIFEMRSNPSEEFLRKIYSAFPTLPYEFKFRLEHDGLGKIVSVPENPKVSVIIPVYNTEKYLRECLDSVVNQTLREIEIICVDDGSTDTSPQILAEYAARDPRIRIITQENAGQGSARNRGIDAAKGDYIYFCDSDDKLPCHALATMLSKIQDADVLLFDSEIFFDSPELEKQFGHMKPLGARKHNYPEGTGRELYLAMAKNGDVSVSPCRQFARREFLHENNLKFPGKIVFEDNLYFFQLSFVAKHVKYIPQKLFLRRIRPSSTMTSTHASPKNFEGYAKSIGLCYELCREYLADEFSLRLKNVACKNFEALCVKMYNGCAPSEQDKCLAFLDTLHSPWIESLKIKISELRLSKPAGTLARKIQDWYRTKTGQVLDLDSPKTLNEKIQWLKCYDLLPIKTRLADKLSVRDWVAEKIGKRWLTQILGVWESFDEIDFASLPKKFVLKTNHGSSSNLVVPDKSALDVPAAKKKFDAWMSRPFGLNSGFEMHYLDIPRRIFAEGFLDIEEDGAYDWAIFCANGEPKLIRVVFGGAHSANHGTRIFYDLNWNKLPFTELNDHVPEIEEPRPRNLEELISAAKTLSQGFTHVWVDFFRERDGKFLFAEMTFTRATGLMQVFPPEYNRWMGDLLELPKGSNNDIDFSIFEKRINARTQSIPAPAGTEKAPRKKYPAVLVRLGAMFILNKAARKRWRERHMDLTPRDGIDLRAHPELRRDPALKRFAVRTLALFIFSKKARKAFREKHLNLRPRDGVDVRKISPSAIAEQRARKRSRNPFWRVFDAIVPATRGKIAHAERHLRFAAEEQTQTLQNRLNEQTRTLQNRLNEQTQILLAELRRSRDEANRKFDALQRELSLARERTDALSRDNERLMLKMLELNQAVRRENSAEKEAQR